MREGWERKDVILPPPPVPNITHVQACVANVSVWFQSKTRLRNRIFGFRRTRNKSRVEKWNRGEREGKEWNVCRQTPGFWKPRSIANGAPVWLGKSNNIDMCRSKVCFILFFPTPSPPFYSRHFSRGLWLSFLVLCSETARKRLLRRPQYVSPFSPWSDLVFVTSVLSKSLAQPTF